MKTHARSPHHSKNQQLIYLDHAATSPPLPAALAAMRKASEQLIGNAAALHTPGHRAQVAVEAARASIAKFIGAQPHEIIFTSGGSEANNTVINTFRNQTIAVSAIEHPSLLQPAQDYTQCVQLPVNQYGQLDPNISFAPSVELVSVMLANNELGTIQPVQQLCAQAQPKSSQTSSPRHTAPQQRSSAQSARFHTDASQVFGKLPIDVNALGIDYLTLSAHKLGGPVGIGALYVREGAPLTPLILGGHQEQNRRAGTTPVANILGFAAAVQVASEQNYPELFQTIIKPLRDQLAERLLAAIPHSQLNHQLTHSLPHLLNLSFKGVEGEAIQLHLDHQGIIVSTGSACASDSAAPSHVLMATTGDAEIAHSSIRFSLGPTTSQADIDTVVQQLPPIIKHLRSFTTIKL